MNVSASPKTSYDIRSRIDSGFIRACSAQRDTLAAIADGARHEIWKSDGAKDMAQWVAGRLGISYWAGSRWVKAASALEHLPATSEALESGALGIDKVLELTRFATADTETELIAWAKRVNPATIRTRADKADAPTITDTQEAHAARYLEHWIDPENAMLRFEGALAQEEGARFVKAIDRVVDELGNAAEDDSGDSIEARRADALVALAGTRIKEDQDPDRATVVVHVDLDSLGIGRDGGRA